MPKFCWELLLENKLLSLVSWLIFIIKQLKYYIQYYVSIASNN